jgi:hypothetical protein
VVVPEPVVHSVRPDGMKTVIAKEDFQPVPGSRVFSKYRPNVFSNRPEHLDASFLFFQEGGLSRLLFQLYSIYSDGKAIEIKGIVD